MQPLHRFLLCSTIALAAIFFTPVASSQVLPQLRCLECRDILEHPEDARNFSINMMYGADSFLSFADTRFRLSDVHGNTITVDINGEYLLDPFDWRLINQLMVRDLVLQVILQYPNGDVFYYKYARSMLEPDGALPVPANGTLDEYASTTTTSASSDSDSSDSGSSGSGGYSDDWDFRDEYYADWEEAYGGWVCRPDFSNPYGSGVICKQG